MIPAQTEDNTITYRTDDTPTLEEFHQSGAIHRAIVGPMGSGKTVAAAQECFRYIPFFAFEYYGIKKTKGVVIRNTLKTLGRTTQKSIFEWFPFGIPRGKHPSGYSEFDVYYSDGLQVHADFIGCDHVKDIREFKSYEITWAWIDESIEVKEEIKTILKGRIGRYPRKSPVKFFIETTNPPEVTHPIYFQYNWNRPPPGPVPKGQPLPDHHGFWQRPAENLKNLPPRYYEDMRETYRDDPDWIEMYIEGMPGIMKQGKLVINNFKRKIHVANAPLKWSGAIIYRGWDNSGNIPACALVQVPTAMHFQVLPSYYSEKMNIVDFANWVRTDCNQKYPNAKFVDWCDPAGFNEFSTKSGTFTSNARLMAEEAKIKCMPSEQNFKPRVDSIEQNLNRIDGILIDPDNPVLIDGLLGGYHFPEIGTTGTFQTTPRKNKYSHIVEALQYVMVKLWKGEEDEIPDLPDLPKENPETYAGVYEGTFD